MRRPKARTPNQPFQLTENQIQTQVRSFLRAKGYFVIRHQQSLGSHKGHSDLTALKSGKVTFVEIKTPSGRQHHWQRVFEEDVKRAGCEYVIFDSLNQCMEWVEREEKLNTGGDG